METLDNIADIIADESMYNGEGIRDARSPGFCFFDKHEDEEETIRWARELALDFEEWSAARTKWEENTAEPEALAYLERQESRQYANWLINWHKRRPSDNDKFHKIIANLSAKMTDEDLDLAVNPLKELINVAKQKCKFAPGPVAGTTFVNPDGTKFSTMGASPMSAKASFCKRHNIEDEFVSMDRVQKEGERTSRYVIGIRKSSADTASNYYDPNPKWMEKNGKDGWVKAYQPSACALYMVPESMVMPSGAHRLTVREFEQALIAGADCFEDEIESFVNAISNDPLIDYRVSSIDTGKGKDFRDQGSLSHEEDYLYGVLRMFGQDEACELLLCLQQEAGLLNNFFIQKGQYTDEAIDILQYVSRDDAGKPEEDKMLPFVKSVILGR